MNLTKKLSKNYKLTFLSLLSIAALMLSVVSCDSCKSGDPTTPETPHRDQHSDKPVDLKLERLSDEVLKQGNKNCYLKISNHGTDKTEPNQLQLLITREKGNVATIVGAQDLKNGTYSLAIPEAIDKGGAAINKSLTINLDTDTEAVFKLQLKYKGEIEEGVEEKVTCQAGKLEILVHQERFFGDQVARLELVNHSENEVDTTDLSVEVVSFNNAAFQLVNIEKGDQKLGVSIDQVQNVFKIKGHIIAKNSGAGVAGLAMLNSNSEIKAEVVVKLKKGQEEIYVSEKVIWEAKGILLKWTAGDSFDDNGPLDVDIVNKGNASISTADIEVSLSNKQQIKFKLGNVNGDKIQTTLTNVIGTTANLDPQGKSVSFKLQLAEDLAAIQQYEAEINLVFQDKNKNVLLEKKIGWGNQSKVRKEAKEVKLIEFLSRVVAQRNAFPAGYKKDTKDVGAEDKHIHHVFNWEHAIRQNGHDVQLIPQFGKRTVETFKTRGEAEALVPQTIADKKRVRELLQQKGKNFPDALKKDFQQVLAVADDFAVVRIDELVKEDFEVVDQCAQAALQKAQFAQGGDQQSLDKATKRIDAWAAVVDQFVTEIGTQAAKDLATKVKEYQAEVHKLQKP